MPRILVTGGAGYIGSHTVAQLVDAGHEVVVVDDLSTGHRAALGPEVCVVETSLADADRTRDTLAEHRPEAIVHFAGSIEAGESMSDPARFYRDNVVHGLHLLDAVVTTNVVPVVFSSSAAVYGEPPLIPVGEDAEKVPTNVYGDTKLMFEHILAAYDRAYGLRSVSLRYFNACGARADGQIGADHRHKTHLVTLAMLTALGQRDSMEVFGTDYPTRDGTCIRDYIHVDDLGAAHLVALDALGDGAATRAYNVGLGRGFTVAEVLDAVDHVVGRPVPRVISPRRVGDPAALVADASRISSELGWAPRFTDLDEIVATAWKWHSGHPHGFA